MQSVQSVQAALRVLELLACHAGPLRVTEIADALEFGKPRVCRHLATLESLGYVRRVGRLGYAAGERLMQVAHQVLRDHTLGETARPQLLALRDELGHTVTLSAPVTDGAVVLNCLEGAGSTPIRVTAGTLLRYPHSPAARLAVALGAGSDAAADPQAARAAAERWREVGVDYELDTQGTGLGGIAAPVFAGSKLVGLVSIVMSSRLLMPKPPTRWVSALRRSVAAIEERMAV